MMRRRSDLIRKHAQTGPQQQHNQGADQINNVRLDSQGQTNNGNAVSQSPSNNGAVIVSVLSFPYSYHKPLANVSYSNRALPSYAAWWHFFSSHTFFSDIFARLIPSRHHGFLNF